VVVASRGASRGAAALLALALLLAAPAAAPAAPAALRFDPPPHADPRDPAARLDLARVAFGQRDLRMVLTVRTRGPWRTSALDGRTLCLVLREHGRACLVRGARRDAFLQFTPDRGEPRVVPGAVTRRDRRSLRAVFAPRAIGLPAGTLRWAVEADGDRAPGRGFHAARVGVIGQPHCFGAAARDPVRRCRNDALRRVVFPRPLDAFTWDNAPCRRLPAQRRGPFEPCEFGGTGPGREATFLLIGDSHAMHWRRSLEVVAEANRWRGVSVARPGCPFSTQIPRTPALGPGACARLHREAIAWLRARPDVKTLFVSNWAPPGSSAIGGTGSYGGGAAAFGAMLDQVPASVERIYVLRDIPRTTVGSVSCVSARRRRGRPLAGACGLRRSSALVPDPGAAAAAGRPRVRVIDLTRFFCGAATCFPVVGGAYVYKDLDHMNAVFALSLGPYVLRALR
jgi:hypothetical protein